MHKQIEILMSTRKALLEMIKDLSVSELNEIPPGFNNNIIWNLAHIISAQQGVCYARSGLKVVVDGDFALRYKPDTKPESVLDGDDIEKIKTLLLSTTDQLEIDYNNNLFTSYTPWTNRYGVTLNNIDEVLAFIPYHEGLHYGYIMALKRMVRSKGA